MLRFSSFNPRSPCGERLGEIIPGVHAGFVSTHAPLAGSDHPVHGFALHAKEVSTHAPLAGSDEGHVGTLRFEF